MEAFLRWSECGALKSLILLTLISHSSLTIEFVFSNLCYCHEERELGDSKKGAQYQDCCLALRNVSEGDASFFVVVLF